MKNFIRTVILLGIGMCIPQAQAVVIDGKDWRQITDTVNFTYNDLAAGVCDTVTGACSGTVTNHVGTTVDLTG